MLNKEIYKTIEYYLYNYNDIDKKIAEVEDELTSSISYSYNGWIKNKHRNISAVEDQAIRIADSKRILKLRKWKKVIYKVLEIYKKFDMQKYKYIELRYFKKYNYKQIESEYIIDASTQTRIKQEVMYYIIIFAVQEGLIKNIIM